MESTESRFAHLLQPIRELTKNWEIDVASELNDYLEEVNSSYHQLRNTRSRREYSAEEEEKRFLVNSVE